MSSRDSARDLSAGYVKIDEKDLRKTGLRGKKLIIVVACLVILWILALITLICNILLMLVLRMNHRGMESMQFMRVDKDGQGTEHLVQFTGENTDLGTMVINSGVISGFKDADFNLTASKVILDAKDSSPPSRLIVEARGIRLENVKNFLVISGNGAQKESQVLFEASKPTFRLKKSIKRLAAAKVVTNKIRAPVTSNLSLSSGRSMILHGTDNCIFEGGEIRFSAERLVTLRVNDQGSLKLLGHGAGRVSLPSGRKLPLSEAPAIRSDKLGLRLCVCKNSGRLFAVQGNDRCRIRESYCY